MGSQDHEEILVLQESVDPQVALVRGAIWAQQAHLDKLELRDNRVESALLDSRDHRDLEETQVRRDRQVLKANLVRQGRKDQRACKVRKDLQGLQEPLVHRDCVVILDRLGWREE